jgi:hypothetical protein
MRRRSLDAELARLERQGRHRPDAEDRRLDELEARVADLVNENSAPANSRRATTRRSDDAA